MRTGPPAVAATAAALAAVAAGAATASGGAEADPAAARHIARLDESRLFIEQNATDGDAGLQLNLDGEPWRSMTLRDPRGRTLMVVSNRSRLRNWGLTSLFFESAEPGFDEVPFSRFKRRFPEGRYRFRGTTVTGRAIAGSARFSHTMPAAPAITSPVEDSVVDRDGLVVRWEAVTRPRGIRIERYIVIVTDEGRTVRELSMELGSRARSATIPPEFLRAGAEHKVEVIARERGGNQTITEIPFQVR